MAERAKRITLDHLMYSRYKHTDIGETDKFLQDFGFTVVHQEAGRVLYRGFGSDPVVYISDQSDDGKPQFLGGGWAVETYEDLQQASKLPGASDITDCAAPIGGKMVTAKDPAGGPLYLHWNWAKRRETDLQIPEALIFNTWDNKRRKGEFQRLPDGPANIHKLGHYGYEVNHSDFQAVKSWYEENFTLAPSDMLFDPETGEDIMVFFHLDHGEEYRDHHSFFLTAGKIESGYEPHHSSYEVDDFDSELKGHIWLEKKGWELVWGVGRHILGSQIFDYWFDPDNFVIEHYADGDLVNCHHKIERVPATPDSISVWGPDVPLAFLTRKAEDRGKAVKGPPPPGAAAVIA